MDLLVAFQVYMGERLPVVRPSTRPAGRLQALARMLRVAVAVREQRRRCRPLRHAASQRPRQLANEQQEQEATQAERWRPADTSNKHQYTSIHSNKLKPAP